MCVCQQFDGFTVGQTYTFSAYIRTANGAYAYATALFGSNEWHNGAHMASTDRWVRISTTFTAAATSGVLYLVTMGGPGTVWFDCAQLEEGPVANRYNMLVNGDFTLGVGAPAGWKANSTNNADKDKVYTGSTGVKPAGLSRNTMRLYGEGRTKYPGIYQDIPHSGTKGDVYVAGGWSTNFAMPRKAGDTGNEFRYNIRVAFHKKGATTWKKVDFANAPSIQWSEEWTDWQFAAGPVVAPVDYDGIRFNVDYERNINYAEFGGLFLHKEEFGQSFTYDANGNVTSTRNAASLQDGATYDAFNNVLTYFQPGRSAAEKTTLTWGESDAEKKKHLLRSSTSPLGTVNKYDYDEYGNRVTTKTSGGGAFMETSTAYTADGNHAQRETDARDNQVQRETDAALDTLKSVTDPRGQKVEYTYDANRRVTQTTAHTADGAYINTYAYTQDKLTQVRHNNTADCTQSVAYSFAYDALNRPTYVQVGTQKLSTTSYNANGTVAGIDYGNGGKVRNSYDGFGRVTGVRYDDETEAHFSYTYGANGEVAQVVDNVRDVTVRSTYDLADRPMCKAITKNRTPELPERQEYLAELTYDKYNNLSTFREEVGAERAGHTTAFAYDSENRPTTISYDSKSGETRQATYTYDKLGRVTQRTVNAGRATVPTSFTYVSGPYGTGSTTPLVASMTQLTRTLKYTYDNAGNITSVSQGDKTVRYTYDTLGQLIRVDDPNDLTTDPAGTTWVFTYDFGGNILTKKGYAYTTGTVGAIQRSYTYVYGDANWKDKLTAINGVSITSDAIGNPLSDGTWTYQWAKGRQLQSMSKPGVSISYTYNEDGLRVGKNVNGTATNYVLHGKNVVHLTRGSDTLHFYYGADGHPTVVEYNGVSYGYTYNLQGDVISLQDADGWTQVQYAYDAWGQPIGKTGAMADTLGTLNPFRYRGYVYDEETGLYYVSSRYYNPAIGRFISPDTADVLTATPMGLTDKNLYAYCDNNPVMREDKDGQIWNWVIGAAVGAVAGFLGQVVSDVVTSIANRELTVSNWQTYAGAIVGGAVGGATLGGTGNVNLTNAAAGFATTGVGLSLEKVTGVSDKSWIEIGANSVADGVISYGLGKFPGVKRVTKGRNSMSAVYKSGLTKLRNGTAARMSFKVIRKGTVSTFVGGLAMDGYYGIKQHAYDRVRALLT